MRLIEFAGAIPYAPSADDAADSSNRLIELAARERGVRAGNQEAHAGQAEKTRYSTKRCRRASTVVAFAISDRPCNAFPPNFTTTQRTIFAMRDYSSGAHYEGSQSSRVSGALSSVDDLCLATVIHYPCVGYNIGSAHCSVRNGAV